MTGLLLLFIATGWVALTAAAAYAATSGIKDAGFRFGAAVFLIGVFLPLPLINEIIGKRQFEQLCRENDKVQVDRAKAFGRTVYLAESTDIELKYKWLRFVIKPWHFVDATTGETVVSYNTLMADGGLFFRAVRTSEGGVPLIFKGSCEPSDAVDLMKLFQELNVTQIQRSELPRKEIK